MALQRQLKRNARSDVGGEGWQRDGRGEREARKQGDGFHGASPLSVFIGQMN